ncbi:MAG: ParB N-terminal domain-containing protein [Burkholderiales bacterium]|nr:ParB N-terminal domain-containing protein [Burkholderiales bacterium]
MSNPIVAINNRPSGGVPNNCQLLDPTLVASSKWANRAPESYSGLPYESLKRDIEECGGNVQPIKVRGTADRYEIVFGHRRHRACLELGIPCPRAHCRCRRSHHVARNGA